MTVKLASLAKRLDEVEERLAPRQPVAFVWRQIGEDQAAARASGRASRRCEPPSLFHFLEHWPNGATAGATPAMSRDKIKRLERRLAAFRQARPDPARRVFRVVVAFEDTEAALARLHAEQGTTDNDLIIVR
jgi:hypothetical protein